MNKPVLVVMAAGMGSRYGGMKQIDPVGPNGQVIMDYSLYDARRAGFETVIFVIKHEIEDAFKAAIGDRVAKAMKVKYAFQQLEELPAGFAVPEGRVKPWGTCHAVLAAKPLIDGPFAVINADDYYGPEAFQVMYDYLSTHADDDFYRYCMVSYLLKNTLSENGSVARGVCIKNEDGTLQSVTERTRIEPCDGGAHYTEDGGESWVDLPGDPPVSMNLWGFGKSFLDEAEQRFAGWLTENLPVNPLKCEYFLPLVVTELIEEGKRVVQETRRWDENKDATFSMRSKENAQDYRYFPEPDLPPLELSEAYIQALRASQPELATAKRARYQAAWGLGPYDAEMLTSQKALARFFEETVALGSEPKQAANWLMGPVLAQLSAHGLEARDMALTPPTLARLIQLVKEGQLNRNTAVRVCEAVFETDGDVDAYVAAHGLAQVSDAGLVAQVVEQVLSANEKSVADYRSGKEKAFGFLVGQVMRQLKGQAAPAVVRQVLLEQLAEQ